MIDGLFVDRVFSIIIHLGCLLSYQHIKIYFYVWCAHCTKEAIVK